MRLPWMGPREQACMLAEKERSSLESDLLSLLRGNGPGSGEIVSVEEPMSAEHSCVIRFLLVIDERSIYTCKQDC